MDNLSKSELKNAARSIREHNRIHSRKEPRAVYITQYLEFAADLIEKIANGKISFAEQRHGRWILCEDQNGVDNDNNNYAYFCSQCHYQDVHSKYAKVNFCWNCGADMREEGAYNG